MTTTAFCFVKRIIVEKIFIRFLVVLKAFSLLFVAASDCFLLDKPQLNANENKSTAIY